MKGLLTFAGLLCVLGLAWGEERQVTPLPPVEVVDSPASGLTSFDRLGLPPDELSYSLDVIETDRFREQGGQRVGDLADFVPGVSNTATGGDGQADELAIRGFDSLWTAVNGIRRVTFDETWEDLSAIERIEILKGAPGVEAGIVGPSGAINLVTKKPEFEGRRSLELRAQRHDHYRIAADVTGPLAPSLAYRLIAAGESGDSFRRGYDEERLSVSPSLTWAYLPGASLTLETAYQYADTPYDSGVFYLEGAGYRDNLPPPEFSFIDPDDYNRNIRRRVAAYLVQPLNASLDLRFSTEYQHRRYRARSFNVFPAELYANDLDEPPYESSGQSEVFMSQIGVSSPTNIGRTAQLELSGRLRVGQALHRAVAGYAISRERLGKTTFGTGRFKLFDVSAPDNDAEDFEMDTDAESEKLEFSLLSRAPFAQYHVEAGPLSLNLGLRYEDFSVEERYTEVEGEDSFEFASLYRAEKLTWRAGALWKLNPTLKAYAGWSTALFPQQGFKMDGSAAPPRESDGAEIGLRYALGRFDTELALFRLRQYNVAEPDPEGDDEFIVIVNGELESRGVEWRVGYRPLPHWKMDAAMAYTRARTTVTGEPGVQGKPRPNVPEHSAIVRSNVDLSRWLREGARWEIAAIYNDERPGDSANSFTLPSYFRLDTGLEIQVDRRLSLLLLAENLLDEDYYEASSGRVYQVYPGEPLNLAIMLRYELD